MSGKDTTTEIESRSLVAEGWRWEWGLGIDCKEA